MKLDAVKFGLVAADADITVWGNCMILVVLKMEPIKK